MFKYSGRYWLCQLAGWGGWTLINFFFAYQFASDYYLNPESKRNVFFIALLIDLICFIAFTHLLREVLKRIPWMRFSFTRVLTMFFISTLTVSLASYYGSKYLSEATGMSFDKYNRNEKKEKAIAMENELQLGGTNYYNYEVNNKIDSSKYTAFTKIKKATGWYRTPNAEWNYEEPRKGMDFWGMLITMILIALWLLIYLVWHYINKNRNDQIDKLRLEAMVKSLELKTIKSHINPHFIFNAHNSIRALVDENPERARQAITELSNILRSSMQAENMETVPLQQELDIVSDYLALEHMRFEERLQIEMQINKDTLGQTVPPMMLQTLVENAIKHGISKNMKGGLVRICSDFKNGHHELIVQNTGSLNGNVRKNKEGFGIISTQQRLNLLYQGKANFEIYDINGGMVESKISMPIAK
ncbi:MAG: histidine kinase [Ferruginibacter sp.]